ncbi:MAG: hypothetical protein V7752_01735 [Halopseudomonas sp.]
MALSATVKNIAGAAIFASAFTLNSLPAYAEATNSDEEWEFMLAPLFLWGINIGGDATLDGNTADLNLDFQDNVLKNMDAFFTLHFEAKKGDLVLFAEYQHVNLDPSMSTSVGPIPVNADIDFKVEMAEFGAGYTLSDVDNVRWEVLGGLRWNSHDIDVTITSIGPFPGKVIGGDEWFQAFVGGRVFAPIANNWTFIGRSDIAYGGSDNAAFHLNLMADYRFNEWGSVFGGYRYMMFDYSDNSYAYNAAQHGPMLGIGFYW